MIRELWFAAGAIAAGLCGAAQAQDVNDLARRFGSRADVQQISLSPSGRQIAYIAPAGHGEYIDAGSPTKQARNIVVPVMLVHGAMDENVDEKYSELMEGALKDNGNPPVFLKFDGLGHALDDSAARIRLLAESDAFLARHSRSSKAEDRFAIVFSVAYCLAGIG